MPQLQQNLDDKLTRAHLFSKNPEGSGKRQDTTRATSF